MKELLLNLLSGAIENIGESKLKDVLQKLHDSDTTANKDKYVAAIRGGWALCQFAKPLVDGTATKIDDAILNGLEDAIKASAEANGVAL